MLLSGQVSEENVILWEGEGESEKRGADGKVKELTAHHQ